MLMGDLHTVPDPIANGLDRVSLCQVRFAAGPEIVEQLWPRLQTRPLEDNQLARHRLPSLENRNVDDSKNPGKILLLEALNVQRSDKQNLDACAWSTISKAGDSHVSWKSDLARGPFFSGCFEERNPFNIPGPFYGAQTDTCDTGPQEAPLNVMLDECGQEFLYRQPTNVDEIRQIIGAAICDPFQGYGADGDENWTVELIREWWRGMGERLTHIENLAKTNTTINQLNLFWTTQASDYLRQYAFFIDNRRLPDSADVLPEL